MPKSITEDAVRDMARDILGFVDNDLARSGVGQLTTFNQLGFLGVSDKPDGWYLPVNRAEVAVILETKASKVLLGASQVDELLKNVRIAQTQYDKVIGILFNGEEVRVFKGCEEIKAPSSLQKVSYYTSLFTIESIDKERIYELTAKINNCLHFEFGIKNLYHRMIFTACALVAKRYDALMVSGMDYPTFTNAIQSSLSKALIRDKKQNQKLELLLDVFSEIRMNLNVNSEDEKEQQHVKDLIGEFIGWVVEISECVNSSEWRGEDVMGIFFNEFNRYKKKSEAGQIFTPEHITDFIYQILEVSKDDRVLDATAGSGGFLIKCMANMIREAGGPDTKEAKRVKQHQLFGIEFDREIYALACANMLIHKDGKTNLEQMDARREIAGQWIAKHSITKVMMNPPYENKYGCMTIVENVLDHVPVHCICAFILPDKKLEKASKKQMTRILKHHRLRKVIKLPEDLFFNVGVTTSIFVFEAGIPQDGKEFFACYMDSDGLATVKNKGRHDVYGKWAAIEAYWVNVVTKQSGDSSCQWVNPNEHLSYQMPQKPFEIFEEDFRKTAMDYLMFQRGIDVKTFSEQLLSKALYGSRIEICDGDVTLVLPKDGDSNGRN
ncbi:MAG: N-6 DNA methylase [Oscillospiraceae bacterium]|nr:N-6 DNA methylase [Oscillospiraceae bacterium]